MSWRTTRNEKTTSKEKRSIQETLHACIGVHCSEAVLLYSHITSWSHHVANINMSYSLALFQFKRGNIIFANTSYINFKYAENFANRHENLGQEITIS